MPKKIYTFFIIPYTLLLLYFMFFGFGRVVMEDHVVRVVPIFSTVSFIEKSLLWNRYFSLAVNILGNILMFVPFGFLGLINRKFLNFKALFITFFSVLIIIETLQYFTRLGVFDVDDLILNTLGLYLGYQIFMRFLRRFLKFDFSFGL